jgi:hypothetical protein
MRIYTFKWQKCISKVFLIVLLSFICVGLSFAQSSGDSSKVTSKQIDEYIEHFVLSEKPITSEVLSKSKKALYESLIRTINNMCGRFNSNSDLFPDGECTTRDKQGDLVEIKVDCQGGSGKTCLFTKEIHQRLHVQVSGQSNLAVQATPNVPSQSSAGLGRWMKIFSGLIYVAITIYLFMIAASNLFKRELLFFLVDLILWAILTAAMYAVMGGQ